MMKRMLASVACGGALLVLTAAGALAADVPPSRYIPPPRAPAYVPFFSWNGFYVGVNAGYGTGKSNWTDTVTSITTGDFDVKGPVAGGTVGYNTQLGGGIFGIEADFDWANIKGSTIVACATGCETRLQWLTTLRGRVGYALDRFLPYLTAGGAFGNVKGTLTSVGSFTESKAGWTAGGGVEYAFVNNWTAKLEYLYVDLGTSRCDAACSGGNPLDVKFNTHLLRGGVNYKF